MTQSTQLSIPEDPKILAKTLLNEYITKEVIADFSQIPVYVKLELLQKTPKRFIEQRKVGDKMVCYIPHQYSKKCLNFSFNFKVSNEVFNQQYHEYDEKYKYQVKDKSTGKMVWKEGERHVVEAECDVKFTFTWQDGTKDCRTVHPTHKQYPNPAICRGDAMKSAISKGWTLAAATFGIGADLEEDYYSKTAPAPEPEQDVIEGEVVPSTVAKSFSPNF